MRGTIKTLKEGFGFIKAQDGKEYFFHHSSVEGGSFEGLHKDQTVEFTPASRPKGPRAEGVRAR